MKLELRPYQQGTADQVREAWRGGAKNVLVQMPTGAGKAVLAASFLDAARQNGHRSVLTCDRLTLIAQLSETLDTYSVPHGIIQADNPRRESWHKVQLASVQTLRARNAWPEDTALAVWDEIHALYRFAREQLKKRECHAIGLTATPYTKGLGKYFDAVVNGTTTYELMRAEWLVPFEVYEPSVPDMQGVRVVNGEWEEEETAKRALKVVGDCVREYIAKGEGRKFIAFAVNVAHAEALVQQFMAAGIVAETYTYRDGDEVRAERVREFRKPESYIRGLVSVESLTRGFDVPDAGVLIAARPLRSSLSLWIQMIGRVLRSSPGKAIATILDHSGNYRRFADDVEQHMQHGVTELDDGKRREAAKLAEKREPEPVRCPKCSFVSRPRPTCPACGHERPRARIEHAEGELVAAGRREAAHEDKTRFYAELLWLAQLRGYKEGWASWTYKEKHGDWPPRQKPEPVQATTETINYITHRMIRRAKGRAKARTAPQVRIAL